MEYNRVLKQGGKMYIEVPAPNCERQHEFNLNHYSILGEAQLLALFMRTGFDTNIFNSIEFDLGSPDENGEIKNFKEKFYCIVLTKTRPLDIK
jgi:hypothetical protein